MTMFGNVVFVGMVVYMTFLFAKNFFVFWQLFRCRKVQPNYVAGNKERLVKISGSLSAITILVAIAVIAGFNTILSFPQCSSIYYYATGVGCIIFFLLAIALRILLKSGIIGIVIEIKKNWVKQKPIYPKNVVDVANPENHPCYELPVVEELLDELSGLPDWDNNIPIMYFLLLTVWLILSMILLSC